MRLRLFAFFPGGVAWHRGALAGQHKSRVRDFSQFLMVSVYIPARAWIVDHNVKCTDDSDGACGCGCADVSVNVSVFTFVGRTANR